MNYTTAGFLAALGVVLASSAAADPVRHRAQPERARTWVLDEQGLFLEEVRKSRLAIRLPEWQWAGPGYACLPDVAIGPRGEAVVTSNVLPVLWKIDPDSLAVSLHRLQLDADTHKDVGFSGIAYSERHGTYFAVSGLTGSLWRIDPLLRRAQKIGLSEPVYGACALSMERAERSSRFTRLCVHGENGSWLVNLAPDQRSAYVQAAGCSADAFARAGGAR